MKKILSFLQDALVVIVLIIIGAQVVGWVERKSQQYFNKGEVYVTKEEVVTKGEFLGRTSSRLRTEDYNTNFLVRYKETLYDCFFQRQDNGNANDLDYGCLKIIDNSPDSHRLEIDNEINKYGD